MNKDFNIYESFTEDELGIYKSLTPGKKQFVDDLVQIDDKKTALSLLAKAKIEEQKRKKENITSQESPEVFHPNRTEGISLLQALLNNPKLFHLERIAIERAIKQLENIKNETSAISSISESSTDSTTYKIKLFEGLLSDPNIRLSDSQRQQVIDKINTLKAKSNIVTQNYYKEEEKELELEI